MKKVFLMFLIVISSLTLNAETPKTTMELLMSQEWENNKVYGLPYLHRFTNNKMVTTVIINNISKITEYLYYLMDNINYEYDFLRVGKSDNGKYIFLQDPQHGMHSVLEIIELTEEKFVYHNLKFQLGEIDPERDYVVFYPKK